MAKITVTGDAVVVTTAVKAEDIKLIEKYRPDALTLRDEETGEPYFCVNTRGGNSISKNGVSFASETHDDAKLASITLVDKELFNSGDIKNAIADKFGNAIANLEKIEAIIPAILEDVEKERALVMSRITLS